MSLDLHKLEKKLDEALSNETSETLNKFLNDKRMTNNKKLTAVEWYISKIKEARNFCDDPTMEMDIRHTLEVLIKKGEQVKSLEKERTKEAMHMQVKKYTTTYLDEDGNPQLSYDIQDSFKDYWNETYGGVKE
jgi:hypothetical protein